MSFYRLANILQSLLVSTHLCPENRDKITLNARFHYPQKAPIENKSVFFYFYLASNLIYSFTDQAPGSRFPLR